MISIFGKSKKLGRFVAAGGVERSPRFIRAITGKTERREKFSIKLRCALKIFHPQVNVIENARSHLFDFRFSRRIINFNPDQVSSTAQTFMSTNPSGRATARITSSVMLVGTPDAFFGQETQTAASSAIFWRRDCKCFANAPRSLAKRWTNFVFPVGRVAKLTPLGILPSSLR